MNYNIITKIIYKIKYDMICDIIYFKYSLLQFIGVEDCLIEFKEFFLKQNLDDNDIKDILRGL